MRFVPRVRHSIWLFAAASMAFTFTTPRAIDAFRLQFTPPPVGPFCLLTAAPATTPSGIWELEAAEDVLPFDLLLEGYPQSASGDHGLVVRVTCTAYTSSTCETDSTPDLTASMKRTRPGYIALSRDLLAEYTPGAPFRFGDKIEIIGKGVYQVEDTMARRWRRRADIWMHSIDEASHWGRRTVLIARLNEDVADAALLDPIQRDGT